MSSSAKKPKLQEQPPKDIPKRPLKKCRVCGNQGVRCAFNYHGLSCESCKSFFRRNAFKHYGKKCTREPNPCDPFSVSRQFCRPCRIRKCFSIGMRTDHFRPMNKPKEQKPVQSQQQPLVHNVPTNVDYYQHCLNTFKTNLESVSTSPMTSRYCETRDGCEIRDIKELMPPGKEKRFVQQLVEYSKALEGFSELNIADKITLLGNSFSEVLLLRSAYNFNFEHDSLMVLLDCQLNISVYTKLDVFYQKVNYLIKLHRGLAYLVHDLMKGDRIVQELTVVLQMLQHQYKLLSPESIGYLYAKYSLLLKLYLFEKFGEADATLKHRGLLALIDQTGLLKHIIEKINIGVSEMPDRENFQHYVLSLMV